MLGESPGARGHNMWEHATGIVGVACTLHVQCKMIINVIVF